MTTPKPASKPQAAATPAIPVPSATRASPKRGSAANRIARQFGGPDGPMGHLVTWLLARGNASFNRWLLHELGTVVRHRRWPPDLGHWRYHEGGAARASRPGPGLPCPVLLGRPRTRPAARTRDPGTGRPHRPRLPAPPAHAADLPAHLPPGRVHPLRLRRPGSMGGFFAIAFAAAHPHRVRRLILSGSPGGLFQRIGLLLQLWATPGSAR